MRVMALAEQFARVFTKGVRARGYSYFRSGRVNVTYSDAAVVRASVRGNQRYWVELQLRRDALHVSCTCPYFAPTGEPCKHIWATVLKADADGLLPALRGRRLSMMAGGALPTIGR